MNHVHDYKPGRGNADVCACGAFQFNEKAGPPVVEQKPVHAMNDRELADMLNRARELGYITWTR